MTLQSVCQVTKVTPTVPPSVRCSGKQTIVYHNFPRFRMPLQTVTSSGFAGRRLNSYTLLHLASWWKVDFWEKSVILVASLANTERQQMKALLKFADRAGTRDEVQIEISKEHFGEGYYASGGRFGCGKTQPTQMGAVRMLVQDMAAIIEVIDLETGEVL